MALREINFIPTDILARRHALRHLCFWAACLLIALSVIWSLYLYHSHFIIAKKSSLTALKDMNEHLGEKIEKIKQLKAEIEKVSQQQSVLGTITKNQAYSIVLLKVAGIMNAYTWLTQLHIDTEPDDQDQDRTTMELIGFSFTNEELGNFLNQLAAESMFNAVILKYANETEMSHWNLGTGESMKLIQFQIECSI